MSTATRGKKAQPPAETPAPRPRRRRWLFTATVLLGLPALMWFAPTIAASGPLVNAIVSRATAEFHGTITVAGATLAWLSPVAVRDVEVRDADGKPLATIPLVTTSKTLLAILLGPRDLGELRIERPQVDVSVRDSGSNIEDAIADWSAPSDKPRHRVGLSLVIVEGIARIDDVTSGRQWQIDELACDLTVPRDAAQPLVVTASGRVSPGEPAGHFSAHVRFEPGAGSLAATAPEAGSSPLAAGKGEIAITSQALALELFEPFVRRLAPGSELAGILDANVNAQWTGDGAGAPRGELNGQIAASRLVIASPALGDDRLRMNSVHVPCSIVREGSRLEIRRCDLQSDFGQLTCAGAIENLDALGPSWMRSLWNALPHTSGEIKGTLDIAKLSQVLPATLRVREGMQIDEGAVNIDFTSGLENNEWACSGHLETTRLVAREQGRQVAWDHPLVVTVSGHDSPQGPVIEKLNGESDFLKFEGSGTPEFFGLTANFELARLVEQLGQFVDFGETRIAGDGFGRVTWKRSTDDAFEADAELQATNFVLARPGKPAWDDARLVVTLSAKGQLDGKILKRLDTGTIHVASGTDDFTATLLSPVAEPSATAAWPIDGHLRGELTRWMARVEPWTNVPAGWDVTGEADVIATVHWSPEVVEIEKCQADFAQLHAWGPGLFIDEPKLRVTATARMGLPTSTLTINDVALTAADVAGQIHDATFGTTESSGAVRIGQAELQGNVATIYRWTHDPREPADWQLNGLMTCALHADLNERSPALDVNVTIDNLTATPRAGQPLRERQVKLTASASYDEANDVLQLAQLEVSSEAAQLTASGKVDRWSKDRAIELAGKADYDLEKLAIVLQPYMRGEILATGRESQSFSLSGPIRGTAIEATATAPAANSWAEQLNAQAGFAWQTASLHGFDVGAGGVQASLAKGTLQIAPTRLKVSGGAVNVAATVRLFPAPAELYMPAGPLVERVQVTPQMCEDWLKFALPPLFRAPKVEGAFSVQLTGCQVPLSNPEAGDVAGQMTIHSIDVEPGPLMQELAVVLGRPTAARLAQESKVDFKMVQGRVYHRGLELQFPELTVRTYGSVGFDQTLAIMAEMAMPPMWIRENALGDALKNQVIRIPIAGTLDHPQIDRQKLAEMRAQLVRDAAGSLLRGGLQQQIDKLLSPLNPKQ